MKEENFDETVFDPDDVKGIDIKLNPDFFIHVALTNAIKVMNKDNLKEAIIQYRMLVDTAEAIAKGRGYIDQNYYNELDKYKKEINKDQASSSQTGLIAIKKFELITQAFSQRQTSTDKLMA